MLLCRLQPFAPLIHNFKATLSLRAHSTQQMVGTGTREQRFLGGQRAELARSGLVGAEGVHTQLTLGETRVMALRPRTPVGLNCSLGSPIQSSGPLGLRFLAPRP